MDWLVYSDGNLDFVMEGQTRRATKRFVFAYEHDVEGCGDSRHSSHGLFVRKELHEQLVYSM
jgi:hypothetical protein